MAPFSSGVKVRSRLLTTNSSTSLHESSSNLPCRYHSTLGRGTPPSDLQIKLTTSPAIKVMPSAYPSIIGGWGASVRERVLALGRHEVTEENFIKIQICFSLGSCFCCELNVVFPTKFFKDWWDLEVSIGLNTHARRRWWPKRRGRWGHRLKPGGHRGKKFALRRPQRLWSKGCDFASSEDAAQFPLPPNPPVGLRYIFSYANERPRN